MITWALFLTLSNALTISLIGRFLGVKGSAILCVSSLGIAFLCIIVNLIDLFKFGQQTLIPLGTWIDSGLLGVKWEILFDGLSGTMLALTTGIAFLVHIYSIEYMQADPHGVRFLGWLNAFTSSMLWLIISSSGFMLLVGWELIGLFSYLLIGFWMTRIAAATAATMAMIVNRVGDLFLFSSLFLIQSQFQSSEFAIIKGLGADQNINKILGVFLVLGCIAKSAQFPMHIWLPLSMQGPTPVSALIHTSTLVTAGVVVLLRLGVLIDDSWNLCLLLGAITAILGGSLAIISMDIKAIIAYSTISQLAYLIIAVSLNNQQSALFHLVIHGLFKAGLFLAAGSIIHGLADNQDIRTSGGWMQNSGQPLTYVLVLVAAAALIGFPYTGGFYSKDGIIEEAAVGTNLGGLVPYFITIFGAALTATYATRLIYYLFEGPAKINNKKFTINESGKILLFPIIILGICCTVGGSRWQELFKGLSGQNLEWGIENLSSNIDGELIGLAWKLLTLIIIGLAIIGTIQTIKRNATTPGNCHTRGPNKIYTFFLHKWWLEQLIFTTFAKTILIIGLDLSYKLIDLGWLEIKGPTAVKNQLLNKWSIIAKKTEGGTVAKDIYFYVTSVVLIILIFSLGEFKDFSFLVWVLALVFSL